MRFLRPDIEHDLEHGYVVTHVFGLIWKKVEEVKEGDKKIKKKSEEVSKERAAKSSSNDQHYLMRI